MNTKRVPIKNSKLESANEELVTIHKFVKEDDSKLLKNDDNIVSKVLFIECNCGYKRQLTIRTLKKENILYKECVGNCPKCGSDKMTAYTN